MKFWRRRFKRCNAPDHSPKKPGWKFRTGVGISRLPGDLLPVIEICPVPDMSELDQALNHLSRYDWVIFTSVNGVEVVWGRFTALGLKGVPSETRVAAIGPKTAQAIRQRGAEPAFIPEEYIAEAILPGLGELTGRWVLLPRAEIARKALPEGICREGGVAHEIAVYQTLPAQPDAIGLAALQAGVDVVTFTSPSTVQNFLTLAERAGFDPLDLPGPTGGLYRPYYGRGGQTGRIGRGNCGRILYHRRSGCGFKKVVGAVMP
jgi:uroporphyrinogen-III synthase